MEEVRRYYEGPVSLTQAEQYIEDSLVTTAREYVVIGYWLRRIRDDKLFLEEGYKNFEEYVRQKYRKDGGWASKCIKVNGQFSVDGNSPYLSEQYQGYSKYQLVELAYMTEEQRELVDAGTSIRDMKQLRKPEPEPENQAAGPENASQSELVTSQVGQVTASQEAEPEPTIPTRSETEQDSCPPDMSSCQRQEWGTGPAEQEAGKKECKACWASWKRQHKALGAAAVEQEPAEPQEPLSAYGTPKRVYPEDSLIAMAGCEGGHSCTSCHVECGIRQEDCYCVDAPMGNPFPCDTLKTIQTLRDEIGSKCQFVDHGLAYHRAGDHEPVPCCRECEEPCEYICGRAKKQLEAKANIPDDEKLPDSDEKWSIGELPQAKESLVRQLARILIQDCGNELRMTPGELGRPSDNTIRKQTDMLVLSSNGFAALPDGVEAYPSEDMIEFFRGDEDLGVCSHARFATQVRRALEDADKAILAGNRSSEVVHNAPRFKTEVQEPNLAETVIDGEFTEIQEPEKDIREPEESLTELQIAQEELERVKKQLNDGLEHGVDENNIHIRRLKTKVCAWASYVCDLDSIMNPPPKPVQPELPPLKNNDQRAAFVDSYETWPLWIETAQTGERYYRYDLEDGTSMVVKVYRAKLFDGYAPGSYDVQYHDGYGRHEYYLLQQGKFFRDCDTNRSLLIEKLKEIQKPKKG